MKLNNKYFKGTLVKRYKRFFADIILDDTNTLITAHCPNPGSMLGFSLDSSLKVWVALVESKTAKLKYRWDFIEQSDETLVGVNTMYPNKIVYEALLSNDIQELQQLTNINPEYKYEQGVRFDFFANNSNQDKILIEVKNVQMKRTDALAEFPDSITQRGTKHLEHLIHAQQNGYKAYMLYLVQRNDIDSIAIAKDIDPKYHAAFLQAQNAGVQMLCYKCDISLENIKLRTPIKINTSI